jgi:putative ABC transport system permease protein
MKFLRLILANLGRNKLRTALTGGAIALAVLLVCVLLAMPAGLDLIVEQLASNTRISVHNKAGIVYPLPFSFVRKVRQLDGVVAAASQTWFGGAYEEEGRVTFPNFAVEPEHVGLVYPDYPIEPEQLADFRRYRDAAIVGGQTMHK